MQDAVDDYLTDHEITAKFAYEEMLECVKTMMIIIKENMKRHKSLI